MIEMRPRALLAALVECRVDFVLIGGLAAMLHGTSRITRDIDIAYRTNAENLERLCKAINGFEPRRMLLGRAEGNVLTLTPKILKKEPMLQLATSAGEVDLLGRVDGYSSYGFLKQQAEILDLGVPTPVLSTDGLVRAKKALQRPKDLQDIVELQALEEARKADE